MTETPRRRDHRGIEKLRNRHSHSHSHGHWHEHGPGRTAPACPLHDRVEETGLRSWRRPRGPVRRSLDERMLGGVSVAVSRRVGIDVTIVRLGFVLVGMAGFGVALYVVGWFFIPLEGEETSIASRSVSDSRGIALAVLLLPLAIVAIALSSLLGAGFIRSFSFSLVVSVVGLVLIARNAGDAERAHLRRLVSPLTSIVGEPGRARRRVLVGRIAIGAAMLLGGVAALADTRSSNSTLWTTGGLFLVAAAIVVVFGPWWLRLGRDLVAERQARARAEERADMAARVHDSVLQTLALIQRRADEPQEVVRLARAQERELRSWLFDGRPPGSANEADATFAEGVRRVQQEVEALHETTVEVVVVGDAPLDERLRGLLAAGREAVVNAAKWSGAPVVSVFAEFEPEGVSLFVRDRGTGFDLGAVPGDRKGLAESVRGRLSRLGGRAEIRSRPGEGTEVALFLPHEDGNRPRAGARP